MCIVFNSQNASLVVFDRRHHNVGEVVQKSIIIIFHKIHCVVGGAVQFAYSVIWKFNYMGCPFMDGFVWTYLLGLSKKLTCLSVCATYWYYCFSKTIIFWVRDKNTKFEHRLQILIPLPDMVNLACGHFWSFSQMEYEE